MTRCAAPRPHLLAGFLAASLLALAAPRGASAQQIGALVSPGPLSRVHARLEGLANCQKCHEPGKKVTAERCLACHKPVAERIAAKKGVHRDVTDDCVSCHVEHAGANAELRPLNPKSFNHAEETGFALDGKHAAIAKDCAKCHKTRSFLGLRPDCASCHQDPHRGALGAACASCHRTAVAFRETATSFDHTKTAFPLSEAHRTVACTKCHVNKVYKGLKFAACTDCHTDPHLQQFGFACANCHSGPTWKTQKVEHARTDFPLAGKHAGVQCASCHKQPPMRAKLEFARCASCHSDPHRGEFPQDCAACHTPAGFRQAGFDHLAKTKFALTGRHAEVPCASCHKAASTAAAPSPNRTVDFRGLNTACSSCHMDVHAGKLGTACASCHETQTFRVATFQHSGPSAFYAGQHANLACAKCHGGEGVTKTGVSSKPAASRTYRGLGTACATCHRDVHLGQLGPNCASCHTIEAPKFAPAGFSHASTKFALVGKHASVECSKCHKSEAGTYPAGPGTAVRFAGLSTQCQTCHQDVHLGQLGARCETCHSPASFKVASYTHQSNPEFHSAKHVALQCQSCHKREEGTFPGGPGTAVRYAGLTTACASCHQDPHQGTLGTRCETCHAPKQWPGASRAFHKSTSFPLEDRHLAVPCGSCHINGQTKGTPNRCYDCHWIRRQDDRFRTRLGTSCELCHRPTTWAQVTFDHGSATGFPLNGAHRSLACESCHINQTFQGGGPTACYDCHRKDFEATRQPAHVTAGFPTTCDTCHRAADTSWSQARFVHTAFQLVGAHAQQPCASCHKNNVYKGTSTACVSCHQTDYTNSKNPSHTANGFPTACESCHKVSDTGWAQGVFNHSATAFPLVGVHATQACATCHADGVYKGKPTACVSCHQTDYTNTKNPNHAASGFPTACESCHKVSDAAWTQGVFNHSATAFPLVGVHATQTCQNCHGDGVYKGKSTACVSCHQTDYTNTKNPNHAASGFPTACESCHKVSDAAWTQGVFNHSTTAFPLLGVHATQPCSACHGDGVYKGKPTACVSCHQTNYNNTKNPNHASSGFPTICNNCHKASDTSWTQGTFNHSTTAFPLLGVHATQTCQRCHADGVYKGKSTACVSCHQTDYTNTRNPNHIAAGFPTTCNNCHKASDTSWTQGTFNHTWFPITSGRHSGNPCSACHTNPSNYAVFSCTTACHPRSETDGHHQGRQGYVYDSQACYSCHPTGRAG